MTPFAELELDLFEFGERFAKKYQYAQSHFCQIKKILAVTQKETLIMH